MMFCIPVVQLQILLKSDAKSMQLNASHVLVFNTVTSTMCMDDLGCYKAISGVA